jgi:hypothetical protein
VDSMLYVIQVTSNYKKTSPQIFHYVIATMNTN